MKAKLVEFSLMARVIVKDGESEDDAIREAIKKVLDDDNIHATLFENCIEVWDDEECPYGEFDTDK